VKAMHRLILTSHTWQLASGPNANPFSPAGGEGRGSSFFGLFGRSKPSPATAFAANSTKDPNNTLWWRAERRRLDAESIRDALLFVSGDLDETVGGAHPFPPVHTWGFTQHNSPTSPMVK
ncbi:MAG: DUF1553 domain-containing protein, partial [Verrucomicrobia bacterium]|nr:DUF1553 domain-containing protein [Verrucomicrobiota bacterium]